MEKYHIEKVCTPQSLPGNTSLKSILTMRSIGYRTAHQKRSSLSPVLYLLKSPWTATDNPCSSIRERVLPGIALLAETLEALSPMVSMDSPDVPKGYLADILRRDEALHLLLPWPLRHPPLQDPIGGYYVLGRCSLEFHGGKRRQFALSKRSFFIFVS